MLQELYEKIREEKEEHLFTFFDGQARESGRIYLHDLARRADAICGVLFREYQLKPGDRVLLCYPPTLEFIPALVGCMFGGLIPVPVYPPAPNRFAQEIENLTKLARGCGARVVLTDRLYNRLRGLAGLRSTFQSFFGRGATAGKELSWVVTDSMQTSPEKLVRHLPKEHDLAFLQYTSGSTSQPKGVRITWANLKHQLSFNRTALDLGPKSRAVFWVPQYHDLGLISGILSALSGNGWRGMLSPLSFLKRPAVWFEVMDQVKATHTAAPDFAYALAVRKTTPKQRAGWDLSSLRVVMNAAEPVRAETTHAFLNAFASSGLQPEAWCPAYGLAEHTVGVTVCGGQIHTFDREKLEKDGEARQGNGAQDITLVSCGKIPVDIRVKVVDPNANEELPEGRVGEIWVDSPSKADGYWGLEARSDAVFKARLPGEEGGFLRSGDLGFLYRGELFVSGRLKDMLIIGGRNIYPSDIEDSIRSCHTMIRPGGVVAFSLAKNTEEPERLGVLVEVKSKRISAKDAQEVTQAIRRQVLHANQLRCATIAIGAPGAVLKTTSGKIRRRACHKALLDGTLKLLHIERSKVKEPLLSPEFASEPKEVESEQVRVLQESESHPDARVFENLLRTVIADLLRIPPSDIALDVPLMEQGISSIQTVELIERAEAALKYPLSPSLAFDYPTIRTLAEYLAKDNENDASETPHVERLSATSLSHQAVTQEPIAVLGIGCRFPGGVVDTESFWRVLVEGRDTITEVPPERWDVDAWYDPDPKALGKMYTRWGGFVDNIDTFDPLFFGISPAEAPSISPQQRLLLESSWEAIERAGLTLTSLKGSDTGVYMGLTSHDYLAHALRDAAAINRYSVLGSAHSSVVGRLSYWLGLKGPNMPVDTACSSSLAAIHLATQAIRAGECSMALAGGVNTILAPEGSVYFSRLQAMSPTGRCHSFSVDADGYVRSEGCGVILLKRLSEAQRDGDPILAVIRGTAVNQDGCSNGLTAPNGLSQQEVIRAALQNGGIEPTSISYIECHGTGTSLGDPVEVQALAAVYNRDKKTPLHIGSVKTNFGHTEGAAGVAGLLKAILSLQYDWLPANLHFSEPNPHIPWDHLAVNVVSKGQAWPPTSTPRRAGVSSFGFSGTNAHVIVEEAPSPSSWKEKGETTPISTAPLPSLLLLSGQSQEALQAHIQQYAAFIEEHEELPLEDICHSLANHRTHFHYRFSLLGENRKDLVQALKKSTQKGSVSRERQTLAGHEKPRIVFVYPGQGSQWLGMGRDLLHDSKVFRDTLSRCDTAIRKEAGFSILSELMASPENARFEQSEVTQPLLFSMALGLTAVWHDFGVEPDVVVGHSQGEVAAAYIAGALSLQDAVAIVCRRSRLLKQLIGRGGMALIEGSVTEIQERLSQQPYQNKLHIAAINSPTSTVISGERAALKALLEELKQESIFARRVSVDYASHSPEVEKIKDALLEKLATVEGRENTTEWLSTVTGKALAGHGLNADYWYKNLRQTVRFDEVIKHLWDSGPSVMIELSPHPLLTLAMEEVRQSVDGKGGVVYSLKRERPSFSSLYHSLGEIFCHGLQADWRKALPGRFVALPTYPFQRQRYWLEHRAAQTDAPSMGLTLSKHPLLGAQTSLSEGGVLFTSRLSLKEQAWLSDHQVFETVLFPGTGFLELAWAAGLAVGTTHVAELTIATPMALPTEGALQLQIRVGLPDPSGQREFLLFSRPESSSLDAPWQNHASGYLQAKISTPSQKEDLQWPPCGAHSVELTDLYQHLAQFGLSYHRAFQGLRELWRVKDVLWAKVELPEGESISAKHFGLHPALLDATLHSLAAISLEKNEGEVLLPFAWRGAQLRATGAKSLYARLFLKDTQSAQLTLFEEPGFVLGQIEELSLRSTSIEQLQQTTKKEVEHLYQTQWKAISWKRESWNPERCVVLGEGPLSKHLGLRCFGDLSGLLTYLDECEEIPAQIMMDATSRGSDDVLLETQQSCEVALCQIQALLREKRLSQSELIWVTQRAIATSSDDFVSSLAHASLWGLLRSAHSEYPTRKIRLLDTDGWEENEFLRRAISASDEPECVLRGKRILAPRLVSIHKKVNLLEPAKDTSDWCLEVGSNGTLAGLQIKRSQEALRPLGANEVRIKVRALGLNFLDVVRTLDMLSLSDRPFLAEASGIVSEVGESVRELQVGDRVMGLLHTSGGPIAISDEFLLTKLPQGFSFVQAATIPVNFLTAYYALLDLGRLQKGENVLIHAATGGTGMAAVQLARHVGAEVFATASPSKWLVLKEQGFDDTHIASSRDLEFEPTFLTHSEGSGVDVVLNSLTHKFVDASLRLLPLGGRFLEMGKIDIRDPEQVIKDHPGVIYRSLDLMSAGPERIREMFQELVKLFESGALTPLPHNAYDLRQAPSAFRFMANAQHTGKVVLLLPPEQRSDGTILLTGGTGELGSLVSRHLARKHGWKHLVLTSRRGMEAPGVAELKAELEELGVSVTIAACDVTDLRSLSKVLDAIPNEAPLRGVIHCSGVLEDASLMTQSSESLANALAPKIRGAWNLHKLTQQSELDFFILFSSIAGVFGSPGQSNYAAANTFLDAFAAHRRKQGLAGQSLAWGLWEQQGTGMTAHLSAAKLIQMEKQGICTLSHKQGLTLLDAAIARPETLLLPAHLKPSILSLKFPALLQEWRNKPSLRQTSMYDTPTTTESIRSQLSAMPAKEQTNALLELVRSEASSVLALTGPSSIPSERPLQELGLDSLMAVELRNRLAQHIQLELSPTLAFDYPTPSAIAVHLSQTLKDTFSGVKAAISEKESQPRELNKATHSSLPPLPKTSTMQQTFARQAQRLPRASWNFYAFELTGPLQPQTLSVALQAVMHEHIGLRTVAVEGQAMVQDNIPEGLFTDVLNPTKVLRSALLDVFAWEATNEKSLEVSPIHWKLLEIDPATHILLIWIHHIGYDGLSLPKIFQSIQRELLLQSFGIPGPSYPNVQAHMELPQKENSYLPSPAAEQDRQYWQNVMATVPPESPYDATQPTNYLSEFRLGPLSQLQQAAVRNQCTPSNLLLWAFAMAAMEFLKTEVLPVGMVVNLRPFYDIGDASPCAINTIPVLVAREHSLQKVAQQTATALKHARLPSEQIQHLTPHKKPPARYCFPVMFHSYLNLEEDLNRPKKAEHRPSLPIQMCRIPTEQFDVFRPYMLSGFVKERNKELFFDGRYQPSSLHKGEMSQIPVLMQRYLQHIEAPFSRSRPTS